MAARIKEDLGISPDLVKGAGGIFLVEVAGEAVAQKTREQGFPEDADIVEAVRAAL